MLLRAVVFVWIALAAGRAAASIVVRDGDPQPGDFPLVAADGRAAPIIVDGGEPRVVAIAGSCLADDVERVTGHKPAVLGAAIDPGPLLIVGTIDGSRAIKSLVDAGRLDVSDLKGQWESFKIVRAGDALVIVGSDRRGAAFGVFEVSRAIGVSPWYWWADVPPKHRDALFIATDSQRVGPPSVKYRGIFLNDEDWGLQPWAAKTFEPEAGDIGPKTYAKVFELLLRLKANYCWPAMHPCTKAFNADPRNAKVADDYAIVMGSSHAEPMLRNNVGEWPHDQAAKWNPVTNLPGVLDYWDTRVRANAKYQNTWTLGMRGIHDSGMPGGGTIQEKRDRLQQIIAAQRDMLARHVDKNVAAVPQTFCPYKEVLDIYRAGLSLPDDVTIVWPDDNYAHIRQLSDARERARSGRSGVYYHLSYNGRPHDYLWLESIPPALIWFEMTEAFEFGADRLWVANVGDLKPIEAGMTLFLELAWQADRYGPDVARAFLRDFYIEQFGPDHGDAIADVKREYFRLCAVRKPETLGWNTVYPNTPVRDGEWSDEQAARFVEQWQDVARRTDEIAARLAPEQRPAYFELVQYPADAAAAMARKMIYAERSRRLAAHGDLAANTYADQAEAAAGRIGELTRQYNEQLGGKWRHMMSDHPRNLPVFGPPVVARADPQAKAPTTAPAAAATSHGAEHVIKIDPAHPARMAVHDARWTVVEGLGSEGAAIALFPRLWPQAPHSRDEFAAAPVADYPLELRDNAGEYDVMVLALPTQPMNADHELVCGVSLDDEREPRLVRFQQSSDERDKVWQQNVLRNQMPGHVIVQLEAGAHTLHLWGLDPSVAVQQIVIALPDASSTTRRAWTTPSTFGAAPAASH
jgi:hypothetical protein